MKAFFAWFLSLFTSSEPIVTVPKVLGKLTLGDTGEQVLYAQSLLGIPLTGVFDEAMETSVESFQRVNKLVADGIIGTAQTWPALLKKAKPVEPTPTPAPSTTGPKWYVYAKKFSGKKETDPEFRKFMEPKWKTMFGMSGGSIATSTWAWCGLAMAVALSGVGLQWDRGGALARNWQDFGQEVEWRTNGIPRGAIVQINHGLNCSSGSGNHIAIADGDCTAADVTKAGATINLYGGNQQNQWKVSTYAVKEICAVRWPSDAAERPYKVMKSINCTSGSSSGESTR